MTTLDLGGSGSVLAPVSDLSDVLQLGQYSESVANGARTEVRTYAGGRRRVVTRPGSTLELSVAYPLVTRANYQALLDLLGVIVCFRDNRQRQVFGVISEIVGNELLAFDRVEDVRFTIVEVDYSEVV
jgi:hypothetical protein